MFATALVAPAVAHADVCTLAPGATAHDNYVAIQACLDSATGAVADLGSGTYPIDHYLAVGTSDHLVGVGATLSFPATPANGQQMIHFTGSSALVDDLVLDANHVLTAGAVMVVFDSTAGNGNTLSNNWIEHGSSSYLDSQPPGTHDPSLNGAFAVSIDCTTCSGNTISDNYIVENYLGIVFKGASSAARNVADGNTIADNQCDPASFSGFGVLSNNTIHDNGARCAPAPGGGVYTDGSGGHDHGGEITGNTIYDTCGHGLDLLNNHDFTISNNVIYDPGTSTHDPTHTYCNGGDGMFLANISNSTISGNDVSNDVPTNMRSAYPAAAGSGTYDTGQAKWSDLPNGGNTLMAFTLVWTRSASFTSTYNMITNNQFYAYCSQTNCLGLSAFVGRGTGYAADNTTTNSTTWNQFRGTQVYGSEYRTRRLGKNWWAASYSCPTRASWSATGCNDDDYNYGGGATTASRNDGAYTAGLYNYS